MELLLGLLLAVLIGLVPAAVAASKGRNFFAWWFYGAALWIVAMPWSLVLKPDRKAIEAKELSTGDVRKCEYCAEIIKSEAKICRYCGRDVEPARASYADNTQAVVPLALDEAAEVKKYGIEFDGERYRYGDYKYEKLVDALAYARKKHVDAPLA